MSLAQQALDALHQHLSRAVEPTAVAVEGADAPVRLRPTGLARAGRSRRNGSLLDLELTVAVIVTGTGPLPLLESLLVAAETYPHAAIGQLPPGTGELGFTVVLPVAVPLAEPDVPAVAEVVVELHPLSTLTGTVVDAGGRGVPGAEIRSSTTSQRVRTDAAGDFRLVGTGTRTTLTATLANRSATASVEPGARAVRLVLSEGS